ncbi:hypothetical protein ABE10_00340, partial [Bacillus toyonensis]|nr:hypothetical protein [Bacillus toyonensis]
REARAGTPGGELPARGEDDRGEEEHLHDAHPQRGAVRTGLALGGPQPELEPDDPDDADHREHHRQDVEVQRHRQLGEIPGADLLELVRHGDRGGLPDELVRASEEEHAREGHDEGGHAHIGDPEALPRTDEHADAEAQEDRDPPREVPLRHRLGHDDAGERGDRADRQVDVPHDDDHHHADREDQDVGVLVDDVDQVLGGERETARQELEQQDDDDQRAEDAELASCRLPTAEHLADVAETESALLGVGRGAHAVAFWVKEVMLRMSASGVAWDAGIQSVTRPSKTV